MTETRSALVVDDERDIRELLVLTLGRMGLRVDTAATLGGAREMLLREKYALCLTDMRLPDGSGIDLVQEISTRHPNTPVAMITAFGNVEAAVEALKAGAFDFVAKPVDLTVLRDLVRHALMLGTHRQQIATSAGPRLQGDSPAMAQLRQTIAKVARSQAPVYIVGESGVGKELTARSIHEQSARAAAPFVPVNCGAIPTELMESELFGHKKGSFTGAVADKQGLIQSAEGGTLFLDEIAEMPLTAQAKILRVLTDQSFTRVGGTRVVKVRSGVSWVMPALGYRSIGAKGRVVPSLVYFDLSTWHRINLLYAPKFVGTLRELQAFFTDPRPYRRLVHVIEHRLGHQLLGQTEAAKIELSHAAHARIDLAAIEAELAVTGSRDELVALLADMLARLVEVGTATVAAAGLAAADVSTLYFTGGSSGMTALRSAFAQAYPGSRAVVGDLFGSVASGLGVEAARRFA